MNKKKLKMVNRLFVLLFVLTISGLMSCQKDIDMTIPDNNQLNGPDTNWYASINENMSVYALKQDIADDFDYDTVVINPGMVVNLVTPSDLHFSINHGSIVTGTGDVFSGNMVVKSMYANSIGKSAQMLKQNLANNGHLLSSGGTFFMAFYNMNNEELFIAPNNNVSVSYHSDNSYNGMKLFTENQVDLVYSNWQQYTDSIHNYITVFGDNHTAHINQTGWINCSTENFYIGQQSRILLHLPSNYTNANTIVYLSFDDLKSVINLDADVTGRNFKTGLVPAGRQAVLTVISKQGGYYFSKQETISTVSTGTTGGYQIISMTPVITTLNNLKNSLRAL